MPPSKKTFLEGRMRRHMRRRGFGELAEYCRWLFSEGGLAEDEDALIDAVTTNKTEFFRERHHFDFLAASALPALGAQGSFVALNNVVSQSVPHLHVHVVPRTRGDGLRGFFWPRQRYADEAEAAAYAQRIRDTLAAGG